MLKLLLFTLASVMAMATLQKTKLFVAPNADDNPAQNKIVAAGKQSIKLRAQQLKKYIRLQGFNEEFCFIIDMAIPSGKKRFFIYNLKKDSVEQSGLVAHGSGSETGGDSLVFKNTPNSLASAIGKYKIGNPYFGQFGLAYKLEGLDKTNNKAMERFIVLHAHSCVGNKEIYPAPLCLSWGCPTVAPGFLKILQAKISSSKKPVLLDLQYLR